MTGLRKLLRSGGKSGERQDWAGSDARTQRKRGRLAASPQVDLEPKAAGMEDVIWICLASAFRICFRGTRQPRDERFDQVFFRMLQGIFEAISEAEHQGQT